MNKLHILMFFAPCDITFIVKSIKCKVLLRTHIFLFSFFYYFFVRRTNIISQYEGWWDYEFHFLRNLKGGNNSGKKWFLMYNFWEGKGKRGGVLCIPTLDMGLEVNYFCYIVIYVKQEGGTVFCLFVGFFLGQQSLFEKW